MASESTFRPALLLMGGRALASAGTLLIPVTLARLFDQSEYGTYKQLFLVFMTLYSVATVGLADSLYYFIPRDPLRGGRYVLNAIAGLALAGTACLVGLHVARQEVARWLKNPALADHLGSIGAFLLLTLIAVVLEIALIARKRYSSASSAYVVSDLVRAGFFVLPVLLLRPGLDVLMLGAVSFSALRVLAAILLLRREFGDQFRLDVSLMPAQLAYAMPFALYVLVDILQSSYHQYAVSWSFDAATFALYAVGCFQVPFVDFLATPASSVMMVRMTEELRAGRPAAALAIWLDITRKLALVFLPMVALLMAVSREIITFLFTDLYAASAPIFTLWVTSIALSVAQTDGVMRVQAQLGFLSLVNLVRLALIVLLIQPLMAAFGLFGPVLATLLGIVAAKAMHLVRMKRLMGLRVAELLPWGSLAGILTVSAVAALPVLAIRAVLAGPPLVVLLAATAVYALTYLTLLLSAGLIQPSERATLSRWLRLTAAAPGATSGAQ